MKALKYDLVTNAKKSLLAGCNLVLYCGGKHEECRKLIKELPYIDKFTVKNFRILQIFKIKSRNESKNLKKISIDIPNYSGPLEILLDLAKSQKVDLAKISISKLADQFLEYIKDRENLDLETASEYLLTATWLAYLKSKLLLPDDEEDDFKALEVAERLKLQLKKLELIRILSDQILKKETWYSYF